LHIGIAKSASKREVNILSLNSNPDKKTKKQSLDDDQNSFHSENKDKVVKSPVFKNKKIKINTTTKDSSNNDKAEAHLQDIKNLYHRGNDIKSLENRFKKEKEDVFLMLEYGQRIYNFKRRK